MSNPERRALKLGLEEIPNKGLHALIAHIDTGGPLLLTGEIKAWNDSGDAIY